MRQSIKDYELRITNWLTRVSLRMNTNGSKTKFQISNHTPLIPKNAWVLGGPWIRAVRPWDNIRQGDAPKQVPVFFIRVAPLLSGNADIGWI